jgi:hypothetical protein
MRYDKRIRLGMVERPYYAYCAYQAALLGKRLGLRRISLVEFGVAGGRGLLNLEAHCERIAQILGMEIDIFGFDTGEGLPPPRDYRDLPHHWKEGHFRMEVDKLRAKLKRAKLVLGNVEDTVMKFFDEYKPSPIAGVMFDLDYYSSSVNAFRMFDASESYLLPRIYCYFDDVIGSEVELYNDFTGVRLALREFNDSHETRKFSKAYHLIQNPLTELWRDQIYIYHDFGHNHYNTYISLDNQQIALK